MERRTDLVVGVLGLTSLLWAVSSGCVPLPIGSNLGGVGASGAVPTLGGSNLPPIAIITASLTGGVAPLEVSFSSDQSTDDGLIVSRQWDFGDGSTSLEISPTHTFQTTGTFTVTLTLTDNLGVQSSATIDITVSEAPVAVITADRTTADNAPATIVFSGSASFDPDGTVEKFRWDFGDGSREELADVSHTFSQSGNYRVRLTVTDDVGITDTTEVFITVGIQQPQIEIRIPAPEVTALTVTQDSALWIQGVFNVEAGVPHMIRAGLDLDTDPSNGNDIQLDTDPSNGNDLGFTAGAGLSLTDVASLGGADVPPGSYRLWAEIDTDRSSSSRVYANATINVIGPLPSTIAPNTPVLPLVNDRASVLVNPDKDRQIFDLGPVAPGDRLFLSLATPPDLSPRFDPGFNVPYSLMLVDTNSKIFTWFERLDTTNFVLFSRDSKLVVARPSDHMYVIIDGGLSLNVRIERGTNLNEPRAQRVFVNFEGSGTQAISVGGLDPTIVPALRGSDINPNWGAAKTQTIKDKIMKRLRELYHGYDIEFISSDDLAADPNLTIETPFLTMYVGGFNAFLFGISDYIDPRNETATGTGITFSTSIGQAANDGLFADPSTTAASMGRYIGTVAAHEIGHLLGLRHTDVPNDLMASGDIGDPSDTTISLQANKVSAAEQFDSLPVIGIQDAPMLLEDTVGTTP